jgi:1-acyl-sn-glycerol-3-phosphate acyltransferase
MLKWLRFPLRGAASLMLVAGNTVFWVVLFIPVILIKLLCFHPVIRDRCARALTLLGSRWVDCNSWVLKGTCDLRWEFEFPEGLSPHASYLVLCNHRSWTDIVVLQHLLRGRIPFLKFFLKKELIYVPLLGIAWWALDFPFMQRYSRQFLEKHPELRGQDMATTRRHCEKFKSAPVAIINFAEGTRFDSSKHLSQDSPFRHLLRPRAGGVGFVLAAMGDCLSSVLDVTIVYPDNAPQAMIWQLFQGKIERVVCHARLLPVPENTAGRDYTADAVFREMIQDWVNGIWLEKDAHIHGVLTASGA